MTTTVPPQHRPAEALRGLCGGAVHLPGDPEYDATRVPWNPVVDQRPAAVAFPADPSDVVALVNAAVVAGLRVAPQGTGHNAAPLGDLSDTVLVRTGAMRAVSVDPSRQTALVQSGALWEDVVTAAAEHGLAALHGSSPDVGVAGYTLGGGLGWYGRKLGVATNSVTAVEMVTADGDLARVDAQHRPELFWAVRGGGGNFGLVTALELRLFPITHAHAGMMIWDISAAEPVVRRWAEWSATAPDEVTTSCRIMRLPPMPELPDFLRGRSLVVIDGAVLGDDAWASELLAPLRETPPEMDTFQTVPAPSLSRLHMDPEGPTPAVGNGVLLQRFDAAAVGAFLEAVGPQATTSLLAAELRQLGGALARDHEGGGALSRLDGSHVAYFVAIAATPEMAAQGQTDVTAAVSAMQPWSGGRNLLNFTERPVDTATAYPDATWTRLRKIRAEVDPKGVFRANHGIPHTAEAFDRSGTHAERG